MLALQCNASFKRYHTLTWNLWGLTYKSYLNLKRKLQCLWNNTRFLLWTLGGAVLAFTQTPGLTTRPV